MIESITRAVLNPSPVNIFKALTPVGALEIYGGKIVEAVRNPTVENLEGALMPSFGPRPSQVAGDVKELWNASSNGSSFWKKGLDIASREVIPGVGRIFLYEIVEGCLNDYRRQAEGKWNKLPMVLIDIIKDYYKIDLTGVSYAENIKTAQANTAIAFPGQIFFPQEISPLSNKSHLRWLLHELVHQDQYNQVGGLRNYLDNYAADIVRKVISTRNFDVHDVLEYEKEADELADRILEDVWTRIQAASNSLRR